MHWLSVLSLLCVLLQSFVSKLYSMSYSFVSIDVHGAR
jgi:hypothetical protein